MDLITVKESNCKNKHSLYGIKEILYDYHIIDNRITKIPEY